MAVDVWLYGHAVMQRIVLEKTLEKKMQQFGEVVCKDRDFREMGWIPSMRVQYPKCGSHQMDIDVQPKSLLLQI